MECSSYRNLDLDETGVIVMASPGWLDGWALYNLSAAVHYVKFYDKATAATSSDTPFLTIGVPAGSGNNMALPRRRPLQNGLSLRCVTGIADNNTTGAGTNESLVNVFYKG